MKVLIFGTGCIYEQNREKLDNVEIVAFLDNDVNKYGRTIDNIIIILPKEYDKYEYDKIIIMSSYAGEMKQQLQQLGCSENKIIHYKEFFALKKKGERENLDFKQDIVREKKCLLITSAMGYHGGSVALVYTALALRNIGYEPTIATYEIDISFKKELIKQKINLLIYPNLQFQTLKELNWVSDYDSIIVNTYPMILCALEIAKQREVYMWLHESEDIIKSMSYWKNRIEKEILNDNIKLYAVSKVAKNNLIKYINIAKKVINILPIGIPDRSFCSFEKEKFVFALIGSIYPLKQQELYLKAIQEINLRYKNECIFYIIGKSCEYKYYKKVRALAENICNVVIKEELSREEIELFYNFVDVLVVPSMQETLSMVAVEAMRNAKVCILSNTCGISDYVIHKQNGFIFENNNLNDLVTQMEYCILNKEEIYYLGKRARKVYEDNFQLNVLADNLYAVLHDI